MNISQENKTINYMTTLHWIKSLKGLKIDRKGIQVESYSVKSISELEF